MSYMSFIYFSLCCLFFSLTLWVYEDVFSHSLCSQNTGAPHLTNGAYRVPHHSDVNLFHQFQMLFFRKSLQENLHQMPSPMILKNHAITMTPYCKNQKKIAAFNSKKKKTKKLWWNPNSTSPSTPNFSTCICDEESCSGPGRTIYTTTVSVHLLWFKLPL